MTGKPPPSPADLERLRDELRAEIREAHGVLKDLIQEIKTARALIPLTVADMIEAEVKRNLALLQEETKKAMDDAVQRVDAQFEELTDLYLRGTRRQRRAGDPTLRELAITALHAAGKDHA